MSEKREIKQINMETLETAERKISAVKIKKGITALALLLVLAGGGYAAFRVVAGDVVASRFTVDKMTCPACAVTVTEVTSKLPGVIGTKVSLAGKEVTVQFREKQTTSDEIRNAITTAGYPARLDGMIAGDGGGIGEGVAATVNGKPIFKKELALQFDVNQPPDKTPDEAAAFFTAVGKEILLQAADKETVVVQPFEIEQEIDRIAKSKRMSKDDLLAQMKTLYGSPEKYSQIVGQRLGIRHYLEDYVLDGVKDPGEKNRKTMALMGKLFSESNVEIVDSKLKERLYASAEQQDWKTFWPRIVGVDTALKSLLIQSSNDLDHVNARAD